MGKLPAEFKKKAAQACLRLHRPGSLSSNWCKLAQAGAGLRWLVPVEHRPAQPCASLRRLVQACAGRRLTPPRPAQPWAGLCSDFFAISRRFSMTQWIFTARDYKTMGEIHNRGLIHEAASPNFISLTFPPKRYGVGHTLGPYKDMFLITFLGPRRKIHDFLTPQNPTH